MNRDKIFKIILTATAKNSQRCLLSTQVKSNPKQLPLQGRECVEVQIPVPWGSIRGKWWGPTNTRPILALHGYQDNAGTFDTLVPLLPPHISFLAIDAPGHGISSHYPPGLNYEIIHLPMLIRKISQVFQWKHVSLLGHSLGGLQSFMYSSIFDDQVDMFIGIELMLSLKNVFKIDHPKVYKKNIDNFLKYMEMNPNNPPVCSYQECIERYVASVFGSVSKEMAPYILNRGIAPSDKDQSKYYFTRDVRIKMGNVPSFSASECLRLFKNIKAPILSIKAINSHVQKGDDYFIDNMNKMKSPEQILDHIEAAGTHHIHLQTPEAVAGPIEDFIEKYDTKDRSQKTNLIDDIFIRKFL